MFRGLCGYAVGQALKQVLINNASCLIKIDQNRSKYAHFRSNVLRHLTISD